MDNDICGHSTVGFVQGIGLYFTQFALLIIGNYYYYYYDFGRSQGYSPNLVSFTNVSPEVAQQPAF